MSAAEGSGTTEIINVLLNAGMFGALLLGMVLAYWFLRRQNGAQRQNGTAGGQTTDFWERRNREVIREEMHQAIRPLDEKMAEVVNLLSVIKDRLPRG